jgi:hypothetical protein
MMRATRENDRISLGLNFLEGAVLRRVLAEVIRNYRLKPGEVDPKIAKWWYSTRGCQSANMTAEETQDWIASLHAVKSANLERLVKWAQELADLKTGQYQLTFNVQEAPALLTILNDHRLMTAALYGIGQAEMDAKGRESPGNLKPAQQTALFLMHFLGILLEEILRVTAPDSIYEP